jgi:hypothetical protein
MRALGGVGHAPKSRESMMDRSGRSERPDRGAPYIPVVCFTLSLLALPGISASVGAEDKPLLKWGKDLFVTHCASCHGKDATGSGPAAKALNPRPADLTQLSQRYGGEFPRLEVVQFIEGQRPVKAHQSAMPRWGAILRKRSDGSVSAGGSIPEIYAITDYLASIQKQ